jgi:hypothetical protein
VLTASCHCGSVKVTVPEQPQTVTDCGCSICSRYGVLWAYYKESTVRFEARAGTTHEYSWGPKNKRFVRCATCGCVMYWQRLVTHPENNMGVNARNFELDVLRTAPVRVLEAAPSAIAKD